MTKNLISEAINKVMMEFSVPSYSISYHTGVCLIGTEKPPCDDLKERFRGVIPETFEIKYVELVWPLKS